MKMSNKVYDVIKFIVQLVLPALATFYVTISGYWNLPFAKEISGTITAIATLLGACLMISSANYNKESE